MVQIDQSGLKGKIRDRPICRELELLLLKAGNAVGIDRIYVTSGGQPGSTGQSTGSTRHNGGRAADLQLIVNGRTLKFGDDDADQTVKGFVVSAAANGAIGIGAGVGYMGPETLHVGFGLNQNDTNKLVWGAGGRSANAPQWLRVAAEEGWRNPPAWALGPANAVREDLPEEDDDITETEEDMVDIPKRFNADVIHAAQATQRQWGVPASITLAQWAIESAYGQRMPPGSNNPFGIKAIAGQPLVTAMTTEFIRGKKVRIPQSFRVFSSLEEAFLKHGELLGSSRIYASARKFVSNPDRFADALTGVYATDPNYGSLLKSIMRSNNLYVFDGAPHLVGNMNQIVQEENVAGTLSQGSVDPVRITVLQQRLVALGYKLGKIDGKFGSLTAGALLAFQSDNGLPTTGVLDATTEDALKSAPRRRLDEERITATEDDLAKSGSRTVLSAQKSRILSWVTGVLGALGLGQSAVTTATSSTTPPVVTTSTASVSQNLSSILDQLQAVAPQPTASQINAIHDKLSAVLAGLKGAPLASDDILHTVLTGLSATMSNVLPGASGSLVLLILGFAGRYFANKITTARVDDQKTGGNINPV